MGKDTASESDSDLSTFSRTKHDITDFSDVDYSEAESKTTKIKVRSKHKCPLEGCKKIFSRPWRLEAHLKLHKNERPFACDVPGCGRAYTNTSHLKRHVQSCHTESVLSKSSIRCTEAGCNQLFKTRQFLARHLRRVHVEFPFACAETGCGKSFKRNRQLKEHMFVHTGIHPYRCETCSRGFEKLYDMKRHARGHRKFTCSIGKCSETFESSKLYRKHMAALHSGGYECSVCGKKFSTTGNRNAHMLCHNTDLPRWPCPHEGCTAVFAQERYARQHAAHKHDDSYRLICPIPGCGKVFLWRRNLLHHSKIEHGEKKKPRKPRKKQAPRKDRGVPKESLAAVMAEFPLNTVDHQRLIEKENFTTDSEVGEIIQTEHAKDVSHILPIGPHVEEVPLADTLVLVNEIPCSTNEIGAR